ncbi:hypothetical protein LWM68_21125 [Niabella sp. W65]|nr:hypothetical protein [Niabella sp. W65]MCH7365037.1 hypothetical protein [Niabella sp. W65]ULT40850.1 hypothetical protein KRR40_40005 [Niabella sp. I65]
MQRILIIISILLLAIFSTLLSEAQSLQLVAAKQSDYYILKNDENLSAYSSIRQFQQYFYKATGCLLKETNDPNVSRLIILSNNARYLNSINKDLLASIKKRTDFPLSRSGQKLCWRQEQNKACNTPSLIF